MPDYKLDSDNSLRDYSGKEYGKVDMYNNVWGQDSRSGFIDSRGRYISESGRQLGFVEYPRDEKSFANMMPEPAEIRRATGSGTDMETTLSVIIIWIVIVALFFAVILLTTPLTAPWSLSNAEKARQRQDTGELRKWRLRAFFASLGAFLFVSGVALLVGERIYAVFWSSLSQDLNGVGPVVLPRILALMPAAVAFFLLFVTGMAPTMMVYFHQRKSQFLTMGRTGKAQAMQLYNWLIGLVAVGTVGLLTVMLLIEELVPRP